MIVEIRTYTTKPGLRDGFLEFFEHEAVPLQRSLGMRILGPFVDLENPNVFIWLRAFPSPQERLRMRESMYQGNIWRNELEGIALPMLERQDMVLTDVPDWFINDFAVAD